MRGEQRQVRSFGNALQWTGEDAEAAYPDGEVLLDGVDARAGGAATRRVFRGWLRNPGRSTVVVSLEVALPAPFLPSAPVLMRRLFTISPGESLRVELGSTVGMSPSTEEVRRVARLLLG